MKYFVMLDGAVVTGFLEGHRAPDPALQPVPAGRTWVEVGDYPPMRSTYNPATQSFAPPPAPPDYGARVSTREFFLRFTRIERTTIRTAATTDNAVADWLDIVKSENTVLLRHPDTLDGLQLLVTKTLLSAARRDAITAG